MIVVMDTTQFTSQDPGDPGLPPRLPRWSGRTRRFLATSAIGAVLLGSGAAIGVALTGGASAATGNTSPTPAVTTLATASSSPGAPGTLSADASHSGGRCANLVAELVAGKQVRLARRLHALCTRPLLRLALVGGEHGTVTFNGKSGPITAAFERGKVTGDTGSAITVVAADGTTWTWQITSSTVVRQAGNKTTAGSIATGDQVFVGGTVVSGAYDARLIRIRSGG